jgi:hypothetical protein
MFFWTLLRRNTSRSELAAAAVMIAVVSVISLFDGLLRTPFDGLIVG